MVDQSQLPPGITSIRLASDVPRIARIAARSRSMNLHEIDLKMVVAAAMKLADPHYPDGDTGSTTRVVLFEGALVAYFRCFDSQGRASIHEDIFNNTPFKAVHREMHAIRGGFVAHDSNGGREAEVFVDIKEDGTTAGTYLMGISSPGVTLTSVASLRTIAEFALNYAIKQQFEIQGAMSRMMKELTRDEIAALPLAQIRSPQNDELSQKKRPRSGAPLDPTATETEASSVHHSETVLVVLTDEITRGR